MLRSGHTPVLHQGQVRGRADSFRPRLSLRVAHPGCGARTLSGMTLVRESARSPAPLRRAGQVESTGVIQFRGRMGNVGANTRARPRADTWVCPYYLTSVLSSNLCQVIAGVSGERMPPAALLLPAGGIQSQQAHGQEVVLPQA